MGNSKKSRKKIEKALMDGVKIYQPKKNKNCSQQLWSSFIQDKFSQQHQTVAKQTFDDDQTLSTSWIYITETNMK